jgi:hypothetical protein
VVLAAQGRTRLASIHPVGRFKKADDDDGTTESPKKWEVFS